MWRNVHHFRWSKNGYTLAWRAYGQIRKYSVNDMRSPFLLACNVRWTELDWLILFTSPSLQFLTVWQCLGDTPSTHDKQYNPTNKRRNFLSFLHYQTTDHINQAFEYECKNMYFANNRINIKNEIYVNIYKYLSNIVFSSWFFLLIHFLCLV